MPAADFSTALSQVQASTVSVAEGSLSDAALEAILHYAGAKPYSRSAETGCGRSTLLLSNISAHHTVFTYSAEELTGDNNLAFVVKSPSFKKEKTHFVFGPTQKTVPQHAFSAPLDFVLIDGPHGFPFAELEYYYFYPHIPTGGVLAIDDIHIPTLRNLFQFLCADAMWELLEVIENKTAFFRRTAAPLTSPTEGNFTFQRYNQLSYPALPFGNLQENPPYRALLALAEALKPCYATSFARRIFVWGTGRFGRTLAELSVLIGLHIDGFVSPTTPQDFPHSPFYLPHQIPVSRPFFLVASTRYTEAVASLKKSYPKAKEGEDYILLPYMGQVGFPWAK